MESMTGFARQSLVNKEMKLNFQFKSLNGRYLEMKFYAPYELGFLEEDFRKVLQEKIQRGSVEVVFYFEKTNMDLPFKSLKKWIKEYKENARKLGVAEDLTMDKVLKQAAQNIQEPIKEQQKKLIVKSFVEGVKKLSAARKKEGSALKQVILAELKNVTQDLSHIKKFINQYKEQIAKDLENRIKELKLEVDPQRFETELAFLLDKSDLTEEINRTGIHIKEFKNVASSKQNLIGKKLDFYCQELVREANTIASKSKSSELTRLSINLKSSIEKLKQQVQNIQ